MRFFWNSVGVEGKPKSKVEVAVGAGISRARLADLVRVWAASGCWGGGGKESDSDFVCDWTCDWGWGGDCGLGEGVRALAGGAGKSDGW